MPKLPLARPHGTCPPLPSPFRPADRRLPRAVAPFLVIAALVAAPLGAAWATTVEVRPAASTDDAEEFSTGSEYLNSTDLELIHDSYDQTVGIRWTNLAIPAGATITAAYVQFASKESRSEVTSLVFAGQAADNAATFSSTKFSLSSRPRTAATVGWSPAAWLSGETGPNERTPDLRTVIQEIVSRPGWASGNALVVVVTGTGHRTAYSFDGKATAAPLLHVEYTTGTPPPDSPPVAHLTVSQLSSPALTVNADGSTSTDADATPIASYHFDFGDGSPVVNTTAPTATAQHTYATTGTYTVKLTCTDTANLTSTQVSQSVTVSSTPTDNPPVAKLTVSQLSSPALTVKADGSTSTDGDATPIASYHFDFGDGSAVVNTTAPTATAQHTYAAAGTYTVKLTCTDTGNLTSSQVSQSITVNPPVTGSTVAVYCGYYDTHHPNYLKPKPNPWRGSANVVFVGTPDKSGGNDWDTAAMRIDNLTSSSLSGVVVSVDVGSKHFALWGTNSIPAGYALILAQTAFENFDGSDLNSAGCYSCNPNDCLTKISSIKPVVHVTVNGVTTNYTDSNQLINTGGVDRAGCPYTGTRNDESESWGQIFPSTAAELAAEASSEEAGPGNEAASSLTVTRQELWLGEPYPNPSRGELGVRFSLPATGPVKLQMFDIAGRLVRTAMNQELEAGTYEEHADLTRVSPGVYFYLLTTSQGTQRKTFVLER